MDIWGSGGAPDFQHICWCPSSTPPPRLKTVGLEVQFYEPPKKCLHLLLLPMKEREFNCTCSLPSPGQFWKEPCWLISLTWQPLSNLTISVLRRGLSLSYMATALKMRLLCILSPHRKTTFPHGEYTTLLWLIKDCFVSHYTTLAPKK